MQIAKRLEASPKTIKSYLRLEPGLFSGICGVKVEGKALLAPVPCLRSYGHTGRHSPNLSGITTKGGRRVIELAARPENRVSFRGEKAWWRVSKDGATWVALGSEIINGDLTGRSVARRIKYGFTAIVPEYATVANHQRNIFKMSHLQQFRNYAGMPFFDEWNRDNGGSFFAGAKRIRDNLGPKPNKNSSIHIVDQAKGFVPSNLEWAHPKKQVAEQMFKIIADQKHHIKELEVRIAELGG